VFLYYHEGLRKKYPILGTGSAPTCVRAATFARKKNRSADGWDLHQSPANFILLKEAACPIRMRVQGYLRGGDSGNARHGET